MLLTDGFIDYLFRNYRGFIITGGLPDWLAMVKRTLHSQEFEKFAIRTINKGVRIWSREFILQFKKMIDDLLPNGTLKLIPDFENKLEQEFCRRECIKSAELAAEKIRVETIALELKRQNIRLQILSMFQSADFISANELYEQEYCATWWERLDYQSKLERSRHDALEREKAEQQRVLQDALLKESEENREKTWIEIRKRLKIDYLSIGAYFQEVGHRFICQSEFEQVQNFFVKEWLRENSPGNKSGEQRREDDEQVSAIAAVNGHVQVIARACSGKTTTLVKLTVPCFS